MSRFSRPSLVLGALRLVNSEPATNEIPSSLTNTVEELEQAGLAETVWRRRGRSSSIRVRLTASGKERLRAANDAAHKVAAGELG